MRHARWRGRVERGCTMQHRGQSGRNWNLTQGHQLMGRALPIPQ